MASKYCFIRNGLASNTITDNSPDKPFTTVTPVAFLGLINNKSIELILI